MGEFAEANRNSAGNARREKFFDAQPSPKDSKSIKLRF